MVVLNCAHLEMCEGERGGGGGNKVCGMYSVMIRVSPVVAVPCLGSLSQRLPDCVAVQEKVQVNIVWLLASSSSHRLQQLSLSANLKSVSLLNCLFQL